MPPICKQRRLPCHTRINIPKLDAKTGPPPPKKFKGAAGLLQYVLYLLTIVAVPMVVHGFYETLLKKQLDVSALAVVFASLVWMSFKIERLFPAGIPPNRTGREGDGRTNNCVIFRRSGIVGTYPNSHGPRNPHSPISSDFPVRRAAPIMP